MSASPPDGDFFPLVYDELRRLAAAKLAGEPAGHSLDATALVHEAYLRLGRWGVRRPQHVHAGRGRRHAADSSGRDSPSAFLTNLPSKRVF